MKKALIAMSGGVDSSVSALIMKKKGYECIGCTMELFQNEAKCLEGNAGFASGDALDAKRLAESLGMPHLTLNLQGPFKEKIIDKFVRSYENGITPNPCIDCNRHMKFGCLLQKAKEEGCEFLVTGHYARIEKEGSRFLLKKALDESKDQSYVLYSIKREALSHIYFPLGTLTKAQVRDIAVQNGFACAQKPDSQDICFVPDGDYKGALERFGGRALSPGDFIDAKGHVLGQHKGITHYTIGQRKGLGISFERPYYVLSLDAENNTVTLGLDEDLFGKELIARDFNWLIDPPSGTLKCKAKVRYRGKEQEASAYVLESGKVHVVFSEPQRAITPGQSVVLYDGDVVLGGGEIEGS